MRVQKQTAFDVSSTATPAPLAPLLVDLRTAAKFFLRWKDGGTVGFAGDETGEQVRYFSSEQDALDFLGTMTDTPAEYKICEKIMPS